MRTLLMVLMLSGMMSTVGVYAAGLGGAPTIKTIGGTGSSTVSGPTSSAMTLDWNFTGADVTGVDVIWTPDTLLGICPGRGHPSGRCRRRS